MNVKRLKDLIDVVENVPAKEFHMDDFCRKTNCGAAGCAAWHYMRRFPRRGMKPTPNGSWPGTGYPSDGSGKTASGVLARHFGLTGEQTYDIFYGDGKGASGKKKVARRIKQIIKAGAL